MNKIILTATTSTYNLNLDELYNSIITVDILGIFGVRIYHGDMDPENRIAIFDDDDWPENFTPLLIDAHKQYPNEEIIIWIKGPSAYMHTFNITDTITNIDFGNREICNVVLKPLKDKKIGSKVFKRGEPLFFFDSLKTGELEVNTTSVYAQGGRGNSKIIAWEGDKVITWRMQDALISPISFSILSGADLEVYDESNTTKVHFSEVSQARIHSSNLYLEKQFDNSISNIYVFPLNDNGRPMMSLNSQGVNFRSQLFTTGKYRICKSTTSTSDLDLERGKYYLLDCYSNMPACQLVVTPKEISGDYKLEAEMLWRRQSDGEDYTIHLTIPHVKVNANMNFTMNAAGDPSVFDFTMDVIPTYLDNNKKKKVFFTYDIEHK